MGLKLKQIEAQSACAESIHKGVNRRLKDIPQTQQQRPELPMVTPIWHASKYKVHKLHLFSVDVPLGEFVTVGDSGLCCCVFMIAFER